MKEPSSTSKSNSKGTYPKDEEEIFLKTIFGVFFLFAEKKLANWKPKLNTPVHLENMSESTPDDLGKSSHASANPKSSNAVEDSTPKM